MILDYEDIITIKTFMGDDIIIYLIHNKNALSKVKDASPLQLDRYFPSENKKAYVLNDEQHILFFAYGFDEALLFKRIEDFEKCYSFEKQPFNRKEFILLYDNNYKFSYYYFELVFPHTPILDNKFVTEVKGFELDGYILYQFTVGYIYLKGRTTRWFNDFESFKIYYQNISKLISCVIEDIDEKQ